MPSLLTSRSRLTATLKSILMEIGSRNGTTKIVKLAMANDWLPELQAREVSPGSGSCR